MNVVQKYGGTCLDTIEKIKAVAEHIAAIKKEGDGIVLVASAMGSTTKELISLAKEMGPNVPKRELDALLSTGEQKSVALLAIALENMGVPAVSLTGFQSGFITSDIHNNARIKELNTQRMEEYLAEGKVVVVAGFQGISEDGDITTLGRGGSDTTAVAIAAQLDWPCELYTDVSGVYTTDPKIYPKARKLDRITYEELMELAGLGGSVLETRSVELAKKYNVSLFVGKALETDKSRGTYIMNDTMLLEDMPVTGISAADDCTIFSLKDMNNDGAIVAQLFQLLAEVEINVDMISKQTYDSGKKCNVAFSCTDRQAEDLDKLLSTNEILSKITVEENPNMSILSLVGVGMATASGVASKVFNILAQENITYYQITTSEISISVTVDMKDKIKAIIALCEAFGL